MAHLSFVFFFGGGVWEEEDKHLKGLDIHPV